MLNLRPATEADIPRLQELILKSGLAVDGVMYDEWSHVVIVAEDGDRIVGLVQVLLGKPYSHVTEMTVDMDYRGQGIGKQLMAAAEETVAASGCKSWIAFTAVERNADALRNWGADYLGQGYGFVRHINGNC